MTIRTLRIPQEALDFLIPHLGGVYQDATRALQEYTTNAIDATIPEVRPTQVNIYIDRPRGRVIVEDQGIGMDYQTVEDLPDNIANSLREVRGLGKTPAIGFKGIGLLAFHKFKAEEMHLCTRPENQGARVPYNHLKFIYGSLDCEVDKSWDAPLEQELHYFDHGTRVVLSSINDIFFKNQFSVPNIKEAMAQRYHPLIRNNKVLIKVGRLNKDGRVTGLGVVEAPELPGEVCLDHLLELDIERYDRKGKPTNLPQKGFLEMCISIDPTQSSGRLLVYSQGQLIRPTTDLDIFELERGHVLKSGKVWGYVDASAEHGFLRPNLQRTEIERNRNSDILVENIEEICPVLEAKVKELSDENERNKKEEVNKQAISAVLKALALAYRIEGGKDTYTKKGEPGPPRGPRGKYGPRTEEPKSPLPLGVNITLEDLTTFGSNIRSSFNDGLGLILINAAHPDCRRVESSPESQKRYFLLVAAAEIARRDYRIRVEELKSQGSLDEQTNMELLNQMTQQTIGLQSTGERKLEELSKLD